MVSGMQMYLLWEADRSLYTKLLPLEKDHSAQKGHEAESIF